MAPTMDSLACLAPLGLAPVAVASAGKRLRVPREGRHYHRENKKRNTYAVPK